MYFGTISQMLTTPIHRVCKGQIIFCSLVFEDGHCLAGSYYCGNVLQGMWCAFYNHRTEASNPGSKGYSRVPKCQKVPALKRSSGN